MVKKHSCKVVRISFQIQQVREADLTQITLRLNKANMAGTPTLHIQIHMDLKQTGGDEIDLGWRAVHYLHDPGWAGRSLMLKICCVRENVWVSVMPTEPSETTEHIGSTGVRVVYRAPLTAGVSVLMNHKTQNDQLSEHLTETFAI